MDGNNMNSNTDERYNGWTNYATWRVHLEMFDGMETDHTLHPQELREMAEEAIEATSTPGYARDYAYTFLWDVNWYEIAAHINEENHMQDPDVWEENDDEEEEV